MPSRMAQLAEWQTEQVRLWLLNDEPSYLACCARLRRQIDKNRRGINGVRAEKFIRNLWGNTSPAGDGMSRVRWSEIAQLLNNPDAFDQD